MGSATIVLGPHRSPLHRHHLHHHNQHHLRRPRHHSRRQHHPHLHSQHLLHLRQPLEKIAQEGASLHVSLCAQQIRKSSRPACRSVISGVIPLSSEMRLKDLESSAQSSLAYAASSFSCEVLCSAIFVKLCYFLAFGPAVSGCGTVQQLLVEIFSFGNALV